MTNLMLITKNLKYRFREPQQYLFIFGFPIGFTLIFWIIFKDMVLYEDLNQFDIFIWGLLTFVITFGTQSASQMFSQEKDKQTLYRLITTPVSTKHIFGAFLISEIIILGIQLLVVYIIAFVIMQVYIASLVAIFLNYLMNLIGGIFCIGLGLILAAVLKPKLASELPMIIVMPIVFLAGVFVPLQSPLIYANPLFWIVIFTKEIGFSGKAMTDSIELADVAGNLTNINIDVGWCIPISIVYSVFFLLMGIWLFQKRMLKR